MFPSLTLVPKEEMALIQGKNSDSDFTSFGAPLLKSMKKLCQRKEVENKYEQIYTKQGTLNNSRSSELYSLEKYKIKLLILNCKQYFSHRIHLPYISDKNTALDSLTTQKLKFINMC